MTVYKRYGSGLAKCRECGEIIEKKEIDLVFEAMGGVRTVVRHFHLKCIESLPEPKKKSQ